MNSTRGYQFEKVNFLDTKELLKYLDEAYEADKKVAKDPEESSRVLFDIFMKVTRHKDLYSRQQSEKPYQELMVGSTGKLPDQLVEEDYKVASKEVEKVQKDFSIIPKNGLFSVPKRLGPLEIESKLTDVDLSSPSRRLIDKDSTPSEGRNACSCWPL